MSNKLVKPGQTQGTINWRHVRPLSPLLFPMRFYVDCDLWPGSKTVILLGTSASPLCADVFINRYRSVFRSFYFSSSRLLLFSHFFPAPFSIFSTRSDTNKFRWLGGRVLSFPHINKILRLQNKLVIITAIRFHGLRCIQVKWIVTGREFVSEVLNSKG